MSWLNEIMAQVIARVATPEQQALPVTPIPQERRLWQRKAAA